jgi:hypothetical protein
MSTDPTPASAPPAKKSRSPVERCVVWGGIVLLLALAAVQAHARFGYTMTLQKLQARIAADDSSETAPPLYVMEVPDLIVGWPTRSVQKDRHWERVTYKWQGLTQSYEISMPYDTSDAQPAVLALETKNAPEPEQPAIVSEETEVANGDTGGQSGAPADGSAGGPGTGGEGGRPRFNLMDSDTDGDGKVSRAEAPERFAANFERADSNGDGFIDGDEYNQYRQARAAEREAAGGGEGGRPRPAENAPADAPAEKPDAPADASTAADKSDVPAVSKTP